MRTGRVLLVAGAVVLVAALVIGGVLAASGGQKSANGHGNNASTTSGGSSPPASTTSGSSAPDPAHSSTFLGPNGVEASWVIAENKRPGTTAWQLSKQPSGTSIAGFTNVTYGALGDQVKLYVQSTAPRWHVEAYRMGYYGGAGGRLVWTSAEAPGGRQPNCRFISGINFVSCDNWKSSMSFVISSAFLPGEYLLKLVGSDGAESYILFTVWDPTSHAAYLFKGDVYTEEAWNAWGGYDFYQGLGNCAPTYPVCNRARVVSFDRPMLTGNGAADFIDNEYPLLRLMEQDGLDVSYIDDVTLQQHPSVLLRHRVLLSLGHDECWSLGERQAAQAAQGKGVNMIFFGASAVLRHVRLESSILGKDRVLVDYRDSLEDPLNGKGNPLEVTGNTWFSPPTDLPETSLVGEMYGGYIEPGDGPTPFVVEDANSWLFKGTGLHNGSAIPRVIWADFDHVDTAWPTPSDLQVLGHSPIPISQVQTDLGQWGQYTYSDATYYTTGSSKAGVFDTGNNNWIFSLTYVPVMQKITNNLLWLFGQGPTGKIDPSVANLRQVQPAGS